MNARPALLAALLGTGLACRRTGLRGRVVVDIAIGPDGRPHAVAVREDLRGAPEVGACVAAIADSMTYAPTTTGAIVVVPYFVWFTPAP